MTFELLASFSWASAGAPEPAGGREHLELPSPARRGADLETSCGVSSSSLIYGGSRREAMGKTGPWPEAFLLPV